MTGRIHSRRAFAALAATNDRRRSGPVSVARVAGADDRPRVAYSVGRGVGPAVTRNRLRRRLRAIVAGLEADGAVEPGHYLIGARRGAVELDHSTLTDHVRRSMEAGR